MFLALKTTHFLSRNGQDTGTSFIVQFHPVTVWRCVLDRINHYERFLRQNNMSNDSELSAFFKSSTDDKDIDVVYSQYTPSTVSYCNLVVLSTSPRHQDILAARFEDHFWEQNRTIFRCYRIANLFFKHGSNFGIESLKCRTFKILKKLISITLRILRMLNCFSLFT